MITLTIDNRKVQVPEGTTIVEAAREIGVRIPTLCALPELNHTPGSCRVCVVEVERSRTLVASCVYPVAEGMKVKTNSERVRRARRTVVELLLSDHPQDCDSSPSLVRDVSKCINCLRCVTVCAEVQGVSLLTPEGRGFDSKIVPAMSADLADSACTYCGQCAVVCPTGAIVEHDDVDKVLEALEDPRKHVVVQEAPAIRATLGEEFGMPPGTLVTGKMIAALRLLGFDKVFDTNFTADLTILEEGSELLKRIKTGGRLPMITSCSPGWIKFIEHFYPALLPHLSTCKSPQQMFGAMAKTYYAESAGVDPKDIFVVSIMPCTAKKYEASRPEMCSSGYRDVDAVLTTRELGRTIRQAGIDFPNLVADTYDAPMGQYTGAGTIFGATGGVMEAALRTVYAIVAGENMPSLDITPVRGLAGVKEAAAQVGELGEVRVAVTHGLANARKVLDKVMDGAADYHFIEIMACPGGCVGGGGQPLPVSNEKRALRAKALYFDDSEVQQLRQSHENPAVKQLYEKFLEEPLGEMSHKLLHTHYVERDV
jgi:iron-only hydrogenase group A